MSNPTILGRFAQLWQGSVQRADILIKTVTLTDAQIKALPATPTTIISAPGSNKRIDPIAAVLYLDSAAGAYTNISLVYADLFLIWNGGAAASALLFNDETVCVNDGVTSLQALSAFLGVASTRMWRPSMQGGYNESYNVSDGLLNYSEAAAAHTNTPLQLVANNNAGNFTGGNAANSLKVRVFYTIEDVP